MPERMWQNPKRLGREQPIDITVGVQGNYPNFKQKLAEKENFGILKVNKSQSLFGKCSLKAAMFQKLTTGALSKETRI